MSSFIDSDGKRRTVSVTSPLPTVAGGGASAGQVQGNSAAGATDVGNPVKVGGRYNSASPTLTTGQRGDLQLDANANLAVTVRFAGNQAMLAGSTDSDSVAASSTANRMSTVSFGYVFDGSVWSRQRGSAKASFVSEPPLTAISRSGTLSTTSAILLPANPMRSKFFIKNDSAVDIWINIGNTAVASAGAGNIKIAAGAYFELQGTSQIVTGIATSGTAAVTCYEF